MSTKPDFSTMTRSQVVAYLNKQLQDTRRERYVHPTKNTQTKAGK